MLFFGVFFSIFHNLVALCIASGALFEVTDLADKKTTNLDLLAHFNGSKLHQKSKILNRFFSTKRIFFFLK